MDHSYQERALGLDDQMRMKMRGRDMRLVWTVAVDVKVMGTVLMPMLVDMKPSDTPIDVDREPDQHDADDSLEHVAGHLWNRSAEHENGASDRDQRDGVPNSPHRAVLECSSQ